MNTPYTPGFVSTHDSDRLAAAAPDLLDALKSLLLSYDDDRSLSNRDGWEAARAAIAKATKETP